MNEMKPEDVMRALECHKNGFDCYQCPMQPCRCEDVLIENALALLREKDAEIERLITLNSQLEAKVFEERNARAEAIDEFAERLAEHATNGYPRKVRLDVIDQIEKEMKGENNG